MDKIKLQILENENSQILEIISMFEKNQSLNLIGRLRNMEVGLKVLKNNKWERLSEYTLPLGQFIVLYDDNFKICDLGFYREI
jgi:hypothetical protein